MAKVEDPKKSFQFNIIAAGLNPYAAQRVENPQVEIEQVTHGDTNHDIKTGGRITVGNATVEKIMPTREYDRWVWDWIEQIQNPITGGGILPQNYKRNLEIVQYAPDGFTITDRWMWYGAWPCVINGTEFNRQVSENTLETIEFAVDICQKVQ